MERQRDDFPSKPPQSHHLQWIWTWLVVSTILKNISQWEGLSHILWKNVENKKCLKPPTRDSQIFCDLFGGQNPRPSGPARFWSLHQRKPGFWVQIFGHILTPHLNSQIPEIGAKQIWTNPFHGHVDMGRHEIPMASPGSGPAFHAHSLHRFFALWICGIYRYSLQ